jgi:hypothetical protein
MTFTHNHISFKGFDFLASDTSENKLERLSLVNHYHLSLLASFLSPLASGGIRIFELWIVCQVFCHCSTAASQHLIFPLWGNFHPKIKLKQVQTLKLEENHIAMLHKYFLFKTK